MKPTCAMITSMALLSTALAPAGAQQVARLDGRVQWIAGPKMMLLPRAGGLPINVDLSRVPQEQYASLRDGNLVRVEGLVSADGRRIVATGVAATGEAAERVDGRAITIPLPPAP